MRVGLVTESFLPDVPPFEAAGFTEAVRELAADRRRRIAFGTAGSAAIEGRSWSSVGDELIRHYAAVCTAGIDERPEVVAA